MKLLFFIESLHPGGKERRLVELLKGLPEFEDISMELALTRRDILIKIIFLIALADLIIYLDLRSLNN